MTEFERRFHLFLIFAILLETSSVASARFDSTTVVNGLKNPRVLGPTLPTRVKCSSCLRSASKAHLFKIRSLEEGSDQISSVIGRHQTENDLNDQGTDGGSTTEGSLGEISPSDNNQFSDGKETVVATTEMTITRSLAKVKVCSTSVCKATADLLHSAMNLSMKPCDDFYNYACGNWIKKFTKIRMTGDINVFNLASFEVLNSLTDSLSTPKSNVFESEAIRKAFLLFEQCNDVGSRTKVGLKPLRDFLSELGGWPMIDADWKEDGYEWIEKVADVKRLLGMGIIASMEISPHLEDSKKNAIHLDQPMLGLTRYYLLNRTANDQNELLVNEYKNKIRMTAYAMGAENNSRVQEDAKDIVDFETAIAEISKSAKDRADPHVWYTQMKVAEVEAKVPWIKWKDFINRILLNADKVNELTEIYLREPNYYVQLEKVINKTSIRVIANYIGWMVANELGSLISSKSFPTSYFSFCGSNNNYNKFFPTNSRGSGNDCIEVIMEVMPFALGRIYIDKFSDAVKKDVEDMYKKVHEAFKQSLIQANWLDEISKKEALRKLEEMTSIIAYPEWIKEDTELDDYYCGIDNLKGGEFFQSFMIVLKTVSRNFLRQWNKDYDANKDCSLANPTTVNAFYVPEANTIFLPAGIIKSPFYDLGNPLSVNYGALGLILGHEMTHGFDDVGIMYDGKGNLKNWLTNSTGKKFKEKMDCILNQYGDYVESRTKMKLHSEDTLPDDIADNGGMRHAFKAYRNIVDVTHRNEKLHNMTNSPDELFFISFARVWCHAYSNPFMQDYIETGSHSPGQFRVLGTISNFKVFSELFGCKADSEMNPKNKCVLW